MAAAQLEDLLPYLMNRLVAQLNQNLSENLRAQGFTFQDWRILAVLAMRKRTNLTELTQATVIPQPSVSRLVANLERRGLLKRSSAKRDSRVVEVVITPKGRTAYRKMLPLAEQEYEAAMTGFSRAQTKELRKAVLLMLKNRGVALARDR